MESNILPSMYSTIATLSHNFTEMVRGLFTQATISHTDLRRVAFRSLVIGVIVRRISSILASNDDWAL